ncbi:MAG: hypothetical protein AAF682_21370 [Planctomycetota bacterium]
MLLAACLLSALQGPDWSGFPAFVWRKRYRKSEAPAELLAGFGGVDVKRDGEADWVREAGLDFYVGHGPGRDDLHLDADAPRWREPWDRWFRTRSDEYLVREPCLTDPETSARLDETLERTLAQHAAGTGFFVALGDEISLTPSQGVPWDGCRSETCRDAWHTRRGEDASMPATDAVRLAWTLGDTSQIGTWLDLRRFHREVVEGQVLRLAEHARERAPGVALGVLGTIGATPFGGLDLARMAAAVDVVECYPEGDARTELATLRAAGRTEARSLLTVFLSDHTPDGVAWQVYEHWLRGGDGVVIWCDADLEESEPHRARLAEALADVRRLKAELGAFRPAPGGIAVVRDDDSAALAFLAEARLDGRTWPNRFPSYQERHGRREVAVRSWLRYVEDCGLLPGVVRLDDLPGPLVFPVVVLPHVAVLAEAGIAALRGFVEAGGILLVEGELGTFSPAGERRSGDVAAELAALREGAVFRMERGLGDYAERRLTMRPEKRRSLLPDEAWSLLERVGIEGLPLVSENRMPWLVARAPHPGEGRVLVAAIPNLTTPAERERLRFVPARLPGGVDADVRWIHPAADDSGEVSVRPGEPLVFELR